MMERLKKTAKYIASEVLNRLGDACGEIAYDYEANPEYADDKIKKMIRKAKKDGVRDVPGWLADELFNDSDTVDMLGDFVYDEAEQNNVPRVDIYRELEVIGHTAVKVYAEQQIKRELEYAKKKVKK